MPSDKAVCTGEFQLHCGERSFKSENPALRVAALGRTVGQDFRPLVDLMIRNAAKRIRSESHEVRDAANFGIWDLEHEPFGIGRHLHAALAKIAGDGRAAGPLNNSPLTREGFDQIKTLLASGCPQTCRHPDHETLSDAVLVRSRV